MQRQLAPYLLLLLAVAGCQSDAPTSPKSSTEVAQNSPSAPAGASETQPKEPATVGPPVNLAPNPNAVPPGPAKSAPVSPKAPAAPLQQAPTLHSGIPAEKMKQIGEQVNKEVTKATAIVESGDWTASSASPSEIAGKIAGAFSKMKNTSGSLYTIVETPEGQGTYKQSFKVQDDKHYTIDFLVLQLAPWDAQMVSNGTYKMVRINHRWLPAVPIASAFPASLSKPGTLAHIWSQDFTRMVFQGLVDHHDAWVPVIDGWMKGEAGYKVKVEERHYPLPNNPKYTYFNYRILAERTPEQAASLGKSTLEIVVDGYHFLPVTIRAVDTDTHGKSWKMMWTCSYGFKKQFTVADFVAPFPSGKPRQIAAGQARKA